MTYKFQYQNAELFASKMSTYGYRLFIMIDHENGTYFYGQSHSTVVSLHTEIDRKHFKAFEPTSYEEAYKLPMIKVMKG